MRRPDGDLEAVAGLHGERADSVDCEVESALDDMAGFDAGMGITGDCHARFDAGSDLHGHIAVNWTVSLLQQGFTPAVADSTPLATNPPAAQNGDLIDPF